MDLIVDSSVVLKMVLPDENDARVEHVFRTANLLVPDLIFLEAANGLRNAFAKRRINLEHVKIALGVIHSLLPEGVPSRALWRRAAEIAIELDHPAYDCAYLALAEREGTDLLTADDRFVRLVRSKGLKRVVTVQEV